MNESIDIFCHYLPPHCCEAALSKATRPLHMLKRASTMEVMVNLEARFRMMDMFPDYRQIVSLSSPPLELIADHHVTIELARMANDALAELVRDYPERFPGFVAALPMNDMDASLAEANRAVHDLGACGVQIFTHVNGRPLDEPEFLPLYALMAELDKPIWLHPTRGMNFPDYATEDVSKFEIWWAFGWPYETSAAMARLVFAGVFDRWPNLKIITHHMGGMVPMMEGRIESGLAAVGNRTPPGQEAAVATDLKERPIDAFRRFYADTASFGSRAAITCGLEFFGIDHMLFASDMPFGGEGGLANIRDTLRIIDQLELSAEDRDRLLNGNARSLLDLPD